MSVFSKNISLCLFLLGIPSAAFAHSMEGVGYVLILYLLIATSVIFINIFSYFARKYGGSMVRKIARVLLVGLLFTLMFIFGLGLWKYLSLVLFNSGLFSLSEYSGILYYLVGVIVFCSSAYFSIKFAPKIIK